jgi:hypothetical protein
MPLTLQIAPQITKAVAEREIAEFAKGHGVRRDDLSNESFEVYELDINFFHEFTVHNDRVWSVAGGARLLPEVIVVGLISAYDGFLASLLTAVIEMHEEIVLTSQKQLTYKELLEFNSIADARTALIEREVESVIRKSHHEQFEWMQNNLNVLLKKGLTIWPKFVEFCERRNLFTHTNGVVSSQYLKVCSEHKCNISDVKICHKLKINPTYYRDAVETIYEIGLKLCYVLWRKFNISEIHKADILFNGRCVDLINAREYRLAEALLTFSKGVPGLTDQIRRMMIVNLANAMRLQDRIEEANKLLDTEDWSAANNSFQVCVASVRGDVDRVLKLMQQYGKHFAAEDYRGWPAFRKTRDDPRFIELFESIFGEPFILPKKEIQTSAFSDEKEAGTVH